MTPTVQAKCPHCQTVLNIPSDWVSKAMRCKHCKSTFQAKANNSKSANVQAGAPALGIPVGKPATAVAAGAPPSSGNPFQVGHGEPEPPSIRRRSNGRGLVLLVAMFFVLFVLGASGAGFVVYKALTLTPPGRDRQVAKGDTTPGTPVGDGQYDKNKGADGTPGKDIKPPIVEPKPKKPPKNDGSTPKTDGKKVAPTFNNDPFPRRALLISVNNYLYYNTVHYGSDVGTFPGYPGSSTSVLRERLTRPPMNFPITQVVELSDGVPAIGKTAKAHSTQKSVIEMTIKDFVESSREQDRVFVFFAGHAVSLEDKSYLVPIDGTVREPDSLLPLKWVYDQLAACKAQQKILVLDVFRYSPSRGFELPGTGDGDEGTMPEAFEKDLLSPPAGVQVWSACLKEQSSVELEGGSAFLQAMCNSMQGGGEMKGFSNPTQPIPIDSLVDNVNKRLKDLVATEKRTQVSRLSGKDPGKTVDYNRDEPLPALVVLKQPPVVGGERASRAQVNSTLELFKVLPVVRETRATDFSLFDGDRLPPFPAKKLDTYKPDKDLAELRKRYKDAPEAFAKDFPLRAAIFDAIDGMQESQTVKLREVLAKADTDPKRKMQMRNEQGPIGISTFKLEQVLAALKEAGEKREVETSRRWLANFDYTQARLQSRLIYLIEYNYLLGRVLADDVPELGPGQTGWRIGSGKKIAVTEKKAKDYAKDTRKLWDRIVKDYPDTPWALMAVREKEIALGLQWRPKSD